MFKLYRICRKVYSPQDPTGASKTPGRWHVPPQRVLYFCSSLSMCILELKANSISFSVIRKKYHFIEIEINPAKVIEEVPASFYSSKNWASNKKPTQECGTNWYREGRSAVLKVRSAVLPVESNLIINTTHPDFLNINFYKPVKIPLDPTLS